MSNSPANAAGRILAQQRQMAGKDVVCPQCGSQHFYEVQSTRYLAGGSGSVEILQDTNEQVFPLLKCAGCDYPVLPKPAVGRRHGGVYESAHKEFRESVQKGQDFLKSLESTSVKTDVLKNVAGKHVEAEVTAVVTKVNGLHDRVSKIETDLGTGTPETGKTSGPATQKSNPGTKADANAKS